MNNVLKINSKEAFSPVLWYLHHYAGSPSLGMSYRPYYLSKEFNRLGYRAFIVGASFHHLLQKETQQTIPIDNQVIDEQEYIFLKTPSYKGNGVGRFINMFSYAWYIWRYRKELIKITGVPSVIIISSGHIFHYIPAFLIAKAYKAKIIFEVRDLWPESLIELLNISRFNLVTVLIRLIEKFAYKRSDYIVSLLPNAFSYMSKYGLTRNRFIPIPNGVAPEQVIKNKESLPDYYLDLIYGKRKEGFFLFGYIGAHGVPNALDDLLHALIELRNEGYQKVHFILVGNGQEKEWLQETAIINNLTSITFFDPLPKNQVISLLELVDAGYLGWKNKQIYNYGVSPNKIFDYMLAAKPILQASSASYDIVTEFQTGITVKAEHHKDIANGIKDMARRPINELKLMGERGRAIATTEFSYEYLAKKYVLLFK